MKKLMLSFAVVLGLAGLVRADAEPNWGNLFDSFSNGVSVHFLDNAETTYYRDLKNGENKLALVTSFFDYGPFSANAGWATPSMDVAAVRTGSALLGATFHIDKFISLAYPQVKDFVYSITPESTHGLIQRSYLGFACSHDFQQNDYSYGLLSGLRF